MTDETKGVREAVDEIPYDYKVWADLIRKNQALAMNVHVDDMLESVICIGASKSWRKTGPIFRIWS